ncbi:DUF2335 domain-containing protein [Acinetobacter sp. ANC 7200]|uniref:DUF2335 domain-containing protein n=1 Tax=Acinetobacter amyesii TaxID=2942470 RepID=UPI0020C153E5|nr:DUF2335 domain-containing protein [Acinetobacter amyesii]MCL6243825.1 DUF2335 domain-containing protein [Acinetobacter amyesii]
MSAPQQDKDEKLEYGSIHVPEAEVVIEPEIKSAERIDKRNSKQFLQIESHTIQSPFLPPEHLEKYEKIIPGMGKELMQVIIKHQNFQMEMKRAEFELNEKGFHESVKVNDANIREQDSLNLARSREIDIKERGQYFALIITVVLLVSALILAKWGHTVLAGSCIGIIVTMSIVMFLQKTHHEKAGDEDSGQGNSDEESKD